MPKVGSQIILCDLPVRFDTYEGCSHACSYCFANRHRDIRMIKPDETARRLEAFIRGERKERLEWIDWDLPLHWGGMSDPFQPLERVKRYSLQALEVFARTQYPFVVSTKNKLIAEEPYLSLIKQCNCVVQFSIVCPQYDNIEKGASTFEERLEAIKKITPYKRVNARCQPYIPDVKNDVIKSIYRLHDAGVHGVIFEGMKFLDKRHPGTKKVGGDICFPSDVLKKDFLEFKSLLHKLGMKFYCGENRLRGISDELCCCGVEGMGWKVNTANLNHFIYDRENFRYTEGQKTRNARELFWSLHQTALWGAQHKTLTYEQGFNEELYPKRLKLLLPDNYKI